MLPTPILATSKSTNYRNFVYPVPTEIIKTNTVIHINTNVFFFVPTDYSKCRLLRECKYHQNMSEASHNNDTRRKRCRRESRSENTSKVRPILPKIPEVYQVQVNDNGILRTYLLPIKDIPPYANPEVADMNNPIDIVNIGSNNF
jgi:hypothetical protein